MFACCMFNHFTGLQISELYSDLSPDIMPAGINFPDFLYLIPITTERTPEATEKKKNSITCFNRFMYWHLLSNSAQNKMIIKMSHTHAMRPWCHSGHERLWKHRKQIIHQKLNQPSETSHYLERVGHIKMMTIRMNSLLTFFIFFKRLREILLPFLLYPINPPRARAAA